MTYQILTTDKTRNPSPLMTLLHGLLVKNVQFAAKILRKDLRKLAEWCAKWRIKLNPVIKQTNKKTRSNSPWAYIVRDNFQ